MNPNLALPDPLQPAVATKAAHLEVAMVGLMEVGGAVAMEHLLPPVEDVRSLSTTSVVPDLYP